MSQPASSSAGESTNCQCPGSCQSCWGAKRKEGKEGKGRDATKEEERRGGTEKEEKRMGMVLSL